jgi:hypothetical protein
VEEVPAPILKGGIRLVHLIGTLMKEIKGLSLVVLGIDHKRKSATFDFTAHRAASHSSVAPNSRPR